MFFILRIPVEESEVLIIGSGGAGTRAAIELHDNGVDVLVVGKSEKRDAHTIMATGGINAALGNLDSKDSWELHAADTIKDGGFINDAKAVELLCKNAPSAVQELRDWGCDFALTEKGKIMQRFFGAATYRRACFVGDHTGKAILNTLIDQAETRGIKFRSEVYIYSLLLNDGKVSGALGVDMKKGELVLFQAKKVILATGGHSRMFKRSSSRFWENNGDGIQLAFDAGAEFMDMEMFQFHPTGMVHPSEAEGVLVTEAVRGEGGVLTNAKGERFMKKYDEERMELSARDVVARAIYQEVDEGRGTRHGGVWLDISHKQKSYIKERLPKMFNQFKKYSNIDISKQKMEVAPTAHYSMGGVHVDHSTGKTRVPNLYAVGEVTSGVHGGNRLGGNSLAEIVVFGKLTAQSVLKDLKKSKLAGFDDEVVLEKLQGLLSLFEPRKGEDPLKVKRSLQKLMWDRVGVVRNEKNLKKALKELEAFKNKTLHVPDESLQMNEKLMAALDVRNMIPTCEMIIKSALKRKESRAAHYRDDYPKTYARGKVNYYCAPSKGKSFKLYSKPVPKTPGKIAKFFDYEREAHLLE